jgi:plastocyanin
MRPATAVAFGVAIVGATIYGCGGGDSGGEKKGTVPSNSAMVLKLSAVAPHKLRFNKERLEATAGPIRIEFTNPESLPHNVQIEQGERCCARAGSKYFGGTKTIGTGRLAVTVNLRRGTYSYYCSTGGHWQTGMIGKLIVR